MLRDVEDLPRQRMLNWEEDSDEVGGLHLGNGSLDAWLRRHRSLVRAAGTVIATRRAVPAAGFLARCVARVNEQVEPARLCQQAHQREGDQEAKHASSVARRPSMGRALDAGESSTTQLGSTPAAPATMKVHAGAREDGRRAACAGRGVRAACLRLPILRRQGRERSVREPAPGRGSLVRRARPDARDEAAANARTAAGASIG